MKALEHKIPPPLIALLCGIAMWWLSTTTYLVNLAPTTRYTLSGLLFVVGLTFAISGILAFRLAKTTVNPLKPHSASSLVTSGVYQLTRNPMYVGLALVLIAWAVFLRAPWNVCLVALFVLYIQWFQIKPEEAAISKLFGEEFQQYKAKVRRWL